MLLNFISHSVPLYGPKFVVYNVHNLAHLAAESYEHGPVDRFSAYPFETKYGGIKRSCKPGYEPLQQAANRDLEKEPLPIIFDIHNNAVTLCNE